LGLAITEKIILTRFDATRFHVVRNLLLEDQVRNPLLDDPVLTKEDIYYVESIHTVDT